MNDIREDLKAYLDGELEAARAQEVEQALASDPTLREEADLMKAMSETLKAMADEPVVSGAATTLAKVRGRRRWNFQQLGMMSGAVGLAVVAILLVRGGPMDGEEMSRNTVSFPTEESSATASDSMPESPGNATLGRGAGGGAGAENSFKNRVMDQAPKRESRPANSGIASSAAASEPTMNPLLIRTANLTVKVPSAAEALAAAERIAKAQGGFTTNTNHSKTEGVTPSATATLRVPVKNFDFALTALRKLGEVTLDQSNSDDVTTEVADIEARLKVMRAEEESYVTMLRAARRVGELLEIKERLSSVRQQIESLDAQRKSLRNMSSYSTINVTLEERARAGEPKKDNWSGDAWTGAVNGLLSVLRSMGQAAIFVFVYSPIWLPILFLGWLVARRMK